MSEIVEAVFRDYTLVENTLNRGSQWFRTDYGEKGSPTWFEQNEDPSGQLVLSYPMDIFRCVEEDMENDRSIMNFVEEVLREGSESLIDIFDADGFEDFRPYVRSVLEDDKLIVTIEYGDIVKNFR